MTEKYGQETALDMVGVRGSIPLAPTISECIICHGNPDTCAALTDILGTPCDLREDADSRERTQNMKPESAQNPSNEFSERS